MPEMLPRFRTPAAQARYHAVYDHQLKRWPVPVQEEYIPTRFGMTHVLVSGPADAPPLLLLHGFGATALMWLDSIAELSRHYRCYCPDTVTDVGKSTCTAPVRSTADYVDWLKELLDGLGLPQVRLTGLSYGGWLSALLALKAPERVKHVVLLCPAGTFSPLPKAFMLRAMPGMITRWAPMIRWYMKWFLYRKELVSHPFTELFVGAFQHFAFSLATPAPAVLSDEELRRISVPTTVLIGDHEVIYEDGPQAALKRAALIPGARVRLVEKASHMMTLDNPVSVMQWLLEGLA